MKLGRTIKHLSKDLVKYWSGKTWKIRKASILLTTTRVRGHTEADIEFVENRLH